MGIKKAVLFILLCSSQFAHVYGQEDGFCDALNTIIRDAPSQFRDIRGNITQDNVAATTWACGIKVPGTMSSRFVSSMGLFYEGAVFQSKNKDELNAIYDNYKGILNSCLAPRGYEMSSSPNFSPGLEAYKKIVFMQEPKENMNPEIPPAHVAMETLYSKESGLYTVVIYIYQH